MAFVVEVERRFDAAQGLLSPIREEFGMPRIAAGRTVEFVLTVGVTFTDDQLTEAGYAFDTDLTARTVDVWCETLSGSRWTELFDFRPTLELVTRHLYRQMSATIAHLAFVQLRDVGFGVLTRYTP